MSECKGSSYPGHVSNWDQDLMKRGGNCICLESARALNCVLCRCGCLASGHKQAHEANVDRCVGMSACVRDESVVCFFSCLYLYLIESKIEFG